MDKVWCGHGACEQQFAHKPKQVGVAKRTRLEAKDSGAEQRVQGQCDQLLDPTVPSCVVLDGDECGACRLLLPKEIYGSG
jgi:hypothetical protein